MRTIKFRAWSKTYKTMIHAKYLDLINDSLVGDGENGKELIQPKPQDKGVLMQFTGLKDKNGKEIYEGDILEWFCMGRKQIEEVIFDEGFFSCATIKEDAMEVVGNIYENSELLKEKEVK